MIRNPILNALVAALCFFIISQGLRYWGRWTGPEFTVFGLTAVLSYFTLWAATMGYILLYQPMQLYLNREKSQAMKLFLKTAVVFAGFTALIFLAVFFRPSFN